MKCHIWIQQNYIKYVAEAEYVGLSEIEGMIRISIFYRNYFEYVWQTGFPQLMHGAV